MGLQFVQCRLNLQTLMVQRGQLLCGGVLRVQHTGDQAINRLGVRHPFQAVLDHPHADRVGLVPSIFLARVDATQIGAIGQPLVTRQNGILLDPPQQLRLRDRAWRHIS